MDDCGRSSRVRPCPTWANNLRTTMDSIHQQGDHRGPVAPFTRSARVKAVHGCMLLKMRTYRGLQPAAAVSVDNTNEAVSGEKGSIQVSVQLFQGIGHPLTDQLQLRRDCPPHCPSAQ